MFIVLPQIVAALNGVNFAASLFGDAAIFALVAAGTSLFISGFCNLLITEKMLSDTMHNIQAVIFDLDGVIVDTAQFHYDAWKTLASEWDYASNKKTTNN